MRKYKRKYLHDFFQTRAVAKVSEVWNGWVALPNFKLYCAIAYVTLWTSYFLMGNNFMWARFLLQINFFNLKNVFLGFQMNSFSQLFLFFFPILIPNSF